MRRLLTDIDEWTTELEELHRERQVQREGCKRAEAGPAPPCSYWVMAAGVTSIARARSTLRRPAYSRARVEPGAVEGEPSEVQVCHHWLARSSFSTS